jgi:ATP-dependent Clp protease, protease subunit
LVSASKSAGLKTSSALREKGKESMTDQPSTPGSPPYVYGVFCGPINEESTKKLLANLATATTKNQNVHLLFQSSGGSVGDGICLYNFFKSLPVGMTVYNVGSVSSIAVIAYLGARHRVTSSRATFMMHRTTVTTTGSPAMVMKGITKSLILDDERAESILRESVTLAGDEKWSNLDHYDFFFSGKEAVEMGLAHEVGEFSPPPGSQVYPFC